MPHKFTPYIGVEVRFREMDIVVFGFSVKAQTEQEANDIMNARKTFSDCINDMSYRKLKNYDGMNSNLVKKVKSKVTLYSLSPSVLLKEDYDWFLKITPKVNEIKYNVGKEGYWLKRDDTESDIDYKLNEILTRFENWHCKVFGTYLIKKGKKYIPTNKRIRLPKVKPPDKPFKIKLKDIS